MLMRTLNLFGISHIFQNIMLRTSKFQTYIIIDDFIFLEIINNNVYNIKFYNIYYKTIFFFTKHKNLKLISAS